MLNSISNQIQGDVASGATNSGNPLQMGGVAVASATPATAVTAGQRAALATDLNGVMMTCPKTLYLSGSGVNLNDVVIAATDVGEYSTVSVEVLTQFGSGGAILFQESNDNTNWAALPVQLGSALNNSTLAAQSTWQTPSQGSHLWGNIRSRYFRVIVSTGGGGTGITLGAFFKSTPTIPTLTSVVFASVATLGDAIANPSVLSLGVYDQIFNGTTWDRQRNNLETILLSSGARTATLSSSDQTNYNATRMALIVNVSSAGSGSITPSIQIKDSISGNYFTVWTAAAVITSGVTTVYKFADGIPSTQPATSSYTECIPFGPPARTWRLTMTHNNANSITYSASADMGV